MSCKSTVSTPMGPVSCCLSPHGPDTWHRAQWAHDGVAYAVEWGDTHRRVGFAELNALQTALAGVRTLNVAATALALSLWLDANPEVARALTRIRGAS